MRRGSAKAGWTTGPALPFSQCPFGIASFRVRIFCEALAGRSRSIANGGAPASIMMSDAEGGSTVSEPLEPEVPRTKHWPLDLANLPHNPEFCAREEVHQSAVTFCFTVNYRREQSSRLENVPFATSRAKGAIKCFSVQRSRRTTGLLWARTASGRGICANYRQIRPSPCPLLRFQSHHRQSARISWSDLGRLLLQRSGYEQRSDQWSRLDE